MSFWSTLKEWFSAEPNYENEVIIPEQEIDQEQLGKQEVEWDDLWDVEREALRQESAAFYDTSEEQNSNIDSPNLEL